MLHAGRPQNDVRELSLRMMPGNVMEGSAGTALAVPTDQVHRVYILHSSHEV